jgi:radical SAM protein with 4Fe4S-binding SPASM domain
MLHPNIRGMVTYAKQMGVPYVDLSTNATIDMTPLLGTSLNELIVSIDGDEKTFSEIRKGGDYTKVVNNLFNFMEKKKAGNYDWPLVRLQIIDFQPPKYDVEKLIEAWLDPKLSHRPKVDVVYRKILEGMTHAIGNKNLPKEEQEKRNKDREPCKQLYYTLTINSNGDIAYCCHDPRGKSVLGNVSNMTLKEAWQKVEKIRQEQMKGIYNEFCRECCDWNTW